MSAQKLWLVSTASFHTFLVRAETAEQARKVAMDGPEVGDVCAAELGYRESTADPAEGWTVEEVLADGPVGVLNLFS